MIAIAAAAATYGTSTAASIGGLASSTATTMGASATTASAALAAAQAGFASLVSQASVALVENKGNLSKTLSRLGQSNTVKSIVASMIIAGSLEGFDIALYGKVTDPAKVTIKLEMLDKRTVEFLKLKLGKDIEIGSKTKLCDNFVGGCGEVLATDQLIRQGINPLNIKISQAYRPRYVYGNDVSELPSAAFIATCANCVEVFKKN